MTRLAGSTRPDDAPVFAVVGRVNKGKSSVIATLAEDDQIAVSPLPGTTRETTELPVRVDGTTLFSLVDTPGFEQAPAVLAWLEGRAVSSDERPQRVHEFVDGFAHTDRFPEECMLLAPILAGAGILYVVDGDKPYRDNYRAEMEILRWTGRPSMALINRGGEHAAAWRTALDQYFKVVRDFDAHGATFDERIRLLTTLRELHEPWRNAVQAAIDALLDEAERRRAEAAHIITELMADALGFQLEAHADDTRDSRKLAQAFHDELRALERTARDRLTRLYHHDRLVWQQAQELVKPVFGEDLFAERTWASLGLSGGQLMATYAASGAVTGALIDAGVGGASFGTGALLGAVAGAGASAYQLTRRFERARRLKGVVDGVKQAGRGGPIYRVGPFKHPNFPFVLLDRALRYQAAARDRAHALSAAGHHDAHLGAHDQLDQRVSPAARAELATLFSKLQKRAGTADPALRAKLFRRILVLLPETGR